MRAPDPIGARPAGRRHPAGAAMRRAVAACGLLLALLAGTALSGAARGEERIVLTRAALDVRHSGDPGAFVDAQFDLPLPAALRDAVDHGIALYFSIDVEVSRSRWYWFDKRLVTDSMEYRLSFSPLTRQYRLARGGLAQPFDSLDQALGTLRRVNQWRVGDASLFDGGRVEARIRLRLDTSMLPKPFQVNALTDRDWTLASDWTPLPVTGDGGH
jgi:hypothetical protein